MLQIISPAKTMDFSMQSIVNEKSNPLFLKKSQELVSIIKSYSKSQLQNLLEISIKLTELNYNRFQTWNIEAENASKELAAPKATKDGEEYEYN